MKNEKRMEYFNFGGTGKTGSASYNTPKKKSSQNTSNTNKRKKPSTGRKFVDKGVARTKNVLSVVGTTVLAILLIAIITICIVAVALTVYVMQFAESSFDIDLNDVELSFSSFIKAYDKEDNEVEIKQLNTDENRVWVDIEDLQQHTIDAFVATEDKRFFEHKGVDWSRTIYVTVRALISDGTEGGSTITQQLVRDITKDNKVTFGRKLREIFRALSLEEKYTKLDILEHYLNRIGFGGTSYGIGSASKHYFNKEASELTIAESAILAGIVRSPSNWNPYADLEASKVRQKYVLEECMYDQGLISTSEYDAALAEHVKFRKPVKGDDYGYIDERYNEYYGLQEEGNEEDDLYYENEDWEDIRTEAYKWDGDYEVSQDWYTDAAINQIVKDLAELRGISETSARDMFYKGGYTAYLNVDLEMQEKIYEVFKDPYTCLKSYDPLAASSDLLQAAFVVMDGRGSIIALTGGIGEKPGDNCYNRATQSYRAIGSTIKPLSVYSLALEKNTITYSTMIRDISGEIQNEENPSDPEDRIRWPLNYEETWPGSGNYITAWYAVAKSYNTAAVRTLFELGRQQSYIHLTDRLGFSSLDPQNDMSWSPLALGQLTNGLLLYELAAAYQIFMNGGKYYEPYLYSKVVDSNGKVILEQDNIGTQAISADTAWITNRMLKQVVEDTGGSAQHSKLPNVEVVGKTGTANDESNLLYAGLTPDYVGVYRIGYDENKVVTKGSGWDTVARVWKKVMEAIIDTETERSFTPDSSTLVMDYCTETGLLKTSKCPNTAKGYYRASNLPKSCDSAHDGSDYWLTHGDPVDFIPYYS